MRIVQIYRFNCPTRIRRFAQNSRMNLLPKCSRFPPLCQLSGNIKEKAAPDDFVLRAVAEELLGDRLGEITRLCGRVLAFPDPPTFRPASLLQAARLTRVDRPRLRETQPP